MNQKVLIIIVTVIVGIVVAGGGYFYYAKNKNVSQQQNLLPTQSIQQSGNIPTLSPQSVGLTLSESSSGKFAGHGLDMSITKLDGIATIDCQFSYTAQGNLPRGGICTEMNVKPGENTIQQEYPYGTCSDVCHFDSDVSDVKMVLKITKTDGTTYQITDSL